LNVKDNIKRSLDMRNMEPLTGTAPSSQPCVGGCLRQRLEAGEVRNGRITRLPDMRPLAR